MKDALASLAHALKLALEKLAHFFDILDLSFFVAGAIALGALAFWGELSDFTYPHWVGGGTIWLAAAVACYVLGVISFATGRAARRLLRWTSDCSKAFESGVRWHGMEQATGLKEYVDRGGIHALYAKAWAELRETEAMKESYELLRRYWTLAAFCDGAAAAMALWLIVIGYWRVGYELKPAPVAAAPRTAPAANAPAPTLPVAAPPRIAPISTPTAVVLCGILAVAIGTCLREAYRYQHYQAEELAATLAFHHPRRQRTDAQDELDKKNRQIEKDKWDLDRRAQERTLEEKAAESRLKIDADKLKLDAEMNNMTHEKRKHEAELAKKKLELERLDLQKEKLELELKKLSGEAKSIPKKSSSN